jgi:hypothetical protein
MFKILLVGGIKGYTENYEHIIQILQNFNSDINNSNTQFISLQIGCPSHEEADLYIGREIHNYRIVDDKLMEKLNFQVKFGHIPYYEKEIIDFDKSLNNSFDFVIGEHCWFCNCVEILKYHNLLKLNGYLIRYATQCFPNGNITYRENNYSYSEKLDNEYDNIKSKIFLKNIANIFKRTHQNIFKKTNNIFYDIEEHNIKYETHCVNYLLNV